MIFQILGAVSDLCDNFFLFILNRTTLKWEETSIGLKTQGYTHGPGCVYLNGEIYTFGGNDEKKTWKLTKEKKWIEVAEMLEAREFISNSSVVFDGCIWVFGGRSLKSAEKYEPQTNKWIKLPWVS